MSHYSLSINYDPTDIADIADINEISFAKRDSSRLAVVSGHCPKTNNKQILFDIKTIKYEK